MRHLELWSTLDAIHAYDTGATDSGIRDEVIRARCRAQVRGMTQDEIRLSLSVWVREAYLSETALEQGYGWEDALAFLTWFENDMQT